jgi:hypothetical protein
MAEAPAQESPVQASKSEPMVALTSSLGEPSIQLLQLLITELRQSIDHAVDLLRWCTVRGGVGTQLADELLAHREVSGSELRIH